MPNKKKGFQFQEFDETSNKFKNYRWAKMLARVFKIEVTNCDKCGGNMRAIAAITSTDAIKRYLKHVGIENTPPARAPPRLVQNQLDFEYDIPTSDQEPVIYLD